MKDIKLAVTMGDPAGVGPEILCKVILDRDFSNKYNLLFVGNKKILDFTFKNVLKVKNYPPFEIVEVGDYDMTMYELGKISSYNGKKSIMYIAKAYNLVKKGYAEGIVTAPINKKAIKLANLKFPGHTEYLGYLSKTSNFSMMLVGNKIKVVLVTTHLPLKHVAKDITKEKIIEAIKNAKNAGKYFGNANPTIAVAGLNPHAGDNGAIGDEEEKIIIPATQDCKQFYPNIIGPIPSDTLFPRMLNGEFDIAVVMYHDQGLIPVKMESFGSAVNVTLNLPFVRTSVDHGTAFDIAGKGVANENSLKQAIRVAYNMVKNAQSFKSI